MTHNLKSYLRAHAESQRAADARAALPIGSTRARVTTANARWARAAEERDRLWSALTHAEKAEADELLRGEP